MRATFKDLWFTGGREGHMKFALTAFSAFSLLACSPDAERVPLAPEPNPTAQLLSIFGYVVEESGICILDATATIVRGQGLGRSVKQVTPCDAWSYGSGFVFDSLIPGVELTVRVSAEGYVAEERAVVPTFVQTAHIFSPARIQ